MDNEVCLPESNAATTWPVLVFSQMLEWQRMQLDIAVAWQGPFSNVCRDWIDAWSCHFGGVPIDG